jgi:hypothetical protein
MLAIASARISAKGSATIRSVKARIAAAARVLRGETPAWLRNTKRSARGKSER